MYQAAGDGVILARGRCCLIRFGATPRCCRCTVYQVVPAVWQEKMPLASGDIASADIASASCASGSDGRRIIPLQETLLL